MDLYNKILNINNLDVEYEIKKIIEETKKEYEDLTKERTCKIYSSIIYKKLKNKGITSRLVDTKDFDTSFSHMFVIAVDNAKKYLIDLTYEQFNNDKFDDLISNGYIVLNDDIFKEYLKTIIICAEYFTIDDALYKNRG